MRGNAAVGGHNAQVTATVLVVDDDPDVLASLERGLRLSGFTVLTASDGAVALRVVADAAPDAVVLDMNMPVLDGTGVVTALRRAGNEVPICVLSARSSVDDRIAGLESGADDYLVKPFVLAELVARIRAMLRRRSVVVAATDTDPPIVVGPLAVDLAGRRVWLGDTEITLTKREFELTEVLARNAGVVLSRERLLDLVWLRLRRRHQRGGRVRRLPAPQVRDRRHPTARAHRARRGLRVAGTDMRPQSLRARVAAATALGATIVVAAVGVYLALAIARNNLQQLDRRLETASRVLVVNAGAAAPFLNVLGDGGAFAVTIRAGEKVVSSTSSRLPELDPDRTPSTSPGPRSAPSPPRWVPTPRPS